MRRLLPALLLVIALTANAGDRHTNALLVRAWPEAPFATIDALGGGVGIVYTPDLSVPGNCRFFQALGFACFESADWTAILGSIRAYNLTHPQKPIRTLILEVHGTNGNGLKVQTSKKPGADRSYIAVGALQERLEADGIRHIVLSACNSRRLLRPEIYRSLDRHTGDKLFLPATCGIHDASPRFNPRRSRITIVTSAESQIEATLVGSLSELAPATRRAIERSAKERGIKLPKQFAVSEMLIRMLLRDDTIQLRSGPGASIDEVSKTMSTPRASEQLFDRFVAHLSAVTARERSTTTVAASR